MCMVPCRQKPYETRIIILTYAAFRYRDKKEIGLLKSYRVKIENGVVTVLYFFAEKKRIFISMNRKELK
ncbi:hypothetical protein K413DRAFT_2694 [Clostridium sp. ASBs410]|nr:hypothetical protein K413DRAFT_2694 [Clostridium sp. ASBs410]